MKQLFNFIVHRTSTSLPSKEGSGVGFNDFSLRMGQKTPPYLLRKSKTVHRASCIVHRLSASCIVNRASQNLNRALCIVNQSKTLTILLGLVLSMNLMAATKTYDITFDSSNNGNNDVHWTGSSVTSLTHDNVTWSTSVTGTTSFTAQTAYCQIGSKNNPATKVTISTNAFAGKKITKVSWTGYCMSNTGPSLTVTAGTTTIINGVSLVKTNSTTHSTDNSFKGVTLGNSDALTFTINSSAKAAICISKIEVTFEEGSSKTLTAVTVSGNPTKTTYNEGESFDPAGLTVKGTYDDASEETITSGITWSYETTDVLAKDQISIKVKATVSEVESAYYTVNGLTVAAAPKYAKVTASKTDWSGEYLLVYEKDGTAYVWTGVDAANCNVSATISSNQIAKPADAATLTIASMTGGYSILVNGGDNNGKYISGTSGKNQINFGTTASLNTIAYPYADGNNSVKIVSNTATMRYNNASNNNRFRYFGNAGQQNIQLYEKVLAPTNEAVTFAAPTDGTLVIKNGGTPITSGTTIQDGTVLDVEFGMTPAEAYKDVAIKVTNTSTSEDVTSTVYNSETQKITMPRYPITVAVTFTKLYKISLVKAGEGEGTATMNGVTTDIYVDGDTQIELVANATAPNEFTSWSATENIAIDEEADAETYAYALGDGTITATFGVSALLPLDAPTLSAPTNITYNSVTLNWQELVNAEGGYNVEIWLDDVRVAFESSIGESYWTSDPIFQANTTYTYTVQGVGDGTIYAEENNPKATSTFTTADYPAATLTLSENGATSTYSEPIKINTPFNLPDCSVECDKVFVGWSTSNENPTDLKTAGTSYTMTEITGILYAWFATETPGTTTWNKVSTVSVGEYVIINSTYYLPSTTSSSSPTQGTAPTITDNKIADANVTAEMKWILSDAGEGKFYVKNSGGDYLYAISDNSGLRVGKTSDSWAFENNNGALAMKESNNSRYCATYGSGSDWRSYTSASHSNYGDGGKLYLYKKQAGAPSYSNYSLTCSAKANAPEFNLTESTYTSAQTLTITAEQGATIYYTLDGTEPTTSSTEYTGAISLNTYGQVTIKAIAYVAEKDPSDVVTKEYMINLPFASLADLVAATEANKIPNNNATVTVTLSNIEIASFNGTKGVNLDVICENKNVQIYNSTAFDTKWKVGGTLSVSNLTCTWQRFVQNSDFKCWELTPTNWDGFTYNAPVHITSIAISGEPTNKDYSDGQQLDPAGLVVTGYYSDHTQLAPHAEVITEGLTWTLPTLEEDATTAQVSVKYTEPILSTELTSDPYQVTINAVTPAKTLQSIYVADDSEHKTEFFVGRPFSSDGLKVMAKYNFGDDQAIIPTSVTPPAMTSAGTKQVTVSYTEGGVTADAITYDITLTYMNLSNLVTATDINDHDHVYVKFENIMITNVVSKGIYLEVQRDDKDIEIYCQSTNHSGDWEQYGTVSATLDNVEWTYYTNGSVWELMISNWSAFTYTAPNIPVTSMEISPAEVSVGELKTTTLSIVYTPEHATNTGVTWAVTEGSEFASVDAETGVVTGIAAGTATITATLTADPSITATRTVTVTETAKCEISYYVKGEVASTQNIVREEEGTLTYEPTLTVTGYTFAGWAEAAIIEVATTATLITKYTPAADEATKKVYAVFKRVDDSSPTYQQYAKVTSALTDWAGDYLIAYSDKIFANGKVGGTDGIGKQYETVDPESALSNNVVTKEWGDQYKVTLEEISAASNTYVLKTQDGKYNYQTGNSNGLASSATKETAAQYPITVTFTSENDVKLALGGGAAGAVFRYNDQGYFRYYKDGGQKAVYLYKYDAGSVMYTSNPPAYTLTYAGIEGYGTSCDLSTKHTYGETITACTPDARDGYTFNGWTRSDEEAPIAAGEEFNMPCHDLTLTATWDSLVTFYVLGENAETQTIDADKHVTGYTPTATCSGKQFMGWSTVNQTELIQDPTSLNLFTDFSDKEFTTPTNLYAVYASINGGKITGKATHDDNVSSYVFSPDVKTCPMQYATYTLDENTKFQNSQIDGKNYIGFKLDASKADAHFTTTKIKDLKSISFDYITNGAAISYYIMISADGTDWTKITDNVTLLSTNTTTHALDAIEVPQGDYYVKVGVTQHTSPSKYAIITRMSYTCATRAIWYSDYATSCTMAERATIRYNDKYTYAASSVGETITISNDSHVTEDYQLYSLKINGVTYNVGDSYILAHDVTPEAADIRPIITWTERYAGTWSQTTTPDNGKLVLPTEQPASFAPGLYEFYGWTTESFDNSKTVAPTIVSAETDAPATPTTYYAVYRKQNNTGDGYTYRQTTPSPLYQLTYSPNGGDGTDYITYTDLTTATTPASSLFTREGATLVGWTLDKDAETIEYVGTSTQITGINGNRHYYAVWIGSLVMNKTIALTSARDATVGSTSFTLSSTDLGTITALRFSYKDVDNNITYSGKTGEPARSKSEFRLCTTSYSLTDADNNVNIENPINFSKEYAIVYMPNSGNKMSHYKLVVELLNNSTVMATQEFDLLGRSLPDKFIIATQKDSKWYALQANMTGSKGWAGVKIDVENGQAFASDTLLYSLRTYNYDKTHVLFQSNVNDGHLWAASGDGTGIRNFATTISGENKPYAWLLNLTDSTNFTTYTMGNANNNRTLSMYGSNFGMYASYGTNTFYFLPLGTPETITIESNSTLPEYEGQNLSHTNLVITTDATLTINQTIKVMNVTVEAGGQLNIVNNSTLTIDGLKMEGGLNATNGSNYAMPRLYIDDGATLNKTQTTVNFDITVDKRNYYPFAVPFPVAVKDINYVDPVLSAVSTYGTHYVIKTYDGARRAEYGENKDANWKVVTADETLKPGVGYILTAVTPAGYDSRIRIPMEIVNEWTTNGEKATYNDVTRNTVAATAHTGTAATTHQRHAGWNFVANPYLAGFAGSENITGEHAYINGKVILTGDPSSPFGYEGEVPYVSVPTYDFSEYVQTPLSEAVLSPEWSFFVQIGTSGTMTFANTGRQQTAPRYLMAENDTPAPRKLQTTLVLSDGNNNSDKTGLIVSNRYTTAYEIGADLEKMFGSGYTLATYTIVGGTRLAYNALSEEEAHTLIPVGYRAPEAGAYTFSLNITDEMAAQFERLDLIDYETGELTNLLTNTYTFTTERTQSDERFAINATIRKVPTDLDDGAPDRNDGVQKVIYDDHLYIIDHNKVYDGTGSLITIKVGSTN